MKSKYLIALTLLVSSTLATPAQAALQGRLDSPEGHSLGIGVFGLSYDYTFDNFSIGTAINTQSQSFGGIPSPSFSPYSNFAASIRSTWRWINWDELQAGLITGITVNSGSRGESSNIQPDLGLGLAYQFRLWDLPMALRLNVSWTIQSESEYGFIQANNFLQRIGLGPSTGLELAFKPMDKMEFTLGGGSIMGMRLKF